MVQDPKFVKVLNDAAEQKDKKGKPRKKAFPVWDQPDLKITGWKFNEWEYYGDHLPSRARGLFTIGDKIALRGYDKFFNIKEVPTTTWEHLEAHTAAPYYATLKENGSLALFSGHEGKLIVTSKHSSGPVGGTESNDNVHSYVSKQWILRHLASVGKTEQDLANELERLDVTAVGELCDDSFEEHVLAYPAERSGIYLTGLNNNTPTFSTRTPAEVNEFAARFGFKVTEFLIFEEFTKLRAFLEEAAVTGSWNGMDIEGFVVRTKMQDDTGDWNDFFFKFKFEEPYLMFRQWREATRGYLANRTKYTLNPRSKHKESTRRYLKFASDYLLRHPELAETIRNTGRGHIELRDKFLECADLNEEDLVKLSLEYKVAKYVLVPVATLGVGKTTTAVALKQLLGWGHVQNDDFQGKKKRELFISTSLEALDTADGVIMDRNNHKREEREQIFRDMNTAAALCPYDIRYVCLNFLPNGPTAESKSVTRNRVKSRKENHQTIRGMDEDKVLGIIGGFEGRFQVVDPRRTPDDEFDLVVDLDVTKDSRTNVLTIIDALNKKYNLSINVDKALVDEAMKVALGYKPKLVPLPSEPKKDKKDSNPVVYFGINIDVNIPTLVNTQFGANPPEIWKTLLEGKKGIIQDEFHVTLAHAKGTKTRFQEFKKVYFKELAKTKGVKGKSPLPDIDAVAITHLCWNDRMVALKVELASQKSANKVAHITVGYLKGASAVQANALVENPPNAMPWTVVPTKLEGQKLFAFR